MLDKGCGRTSRPREKACKIAQDVCIPHDVRRTTPASVQQTISPSSCHTFTRPRSDSLLRCARVPRCGRRARLRTGRSRRTDQTGRSGLFPSGAGCAAGGRRDPQAWSAADGQGDLTPESAGNLPSAGAVGRSSGRPPARILRAGIEGGQAVSVREVMNLTPLRHLELLGES